MTNAKARTSELEKLAEQLAEAASEMELQDPGQHEKGWDRIVNQTAEAFGAILLVTMAVLTFCNGAMRYAFSSPIQWTEELVVVMLPWLAMVGLFLSVRRNQLIRVEAIVERLPLRVQYCVNLFTQILSVGVCTYFAYLGFQYLALFGSDRTLYFSMPKGFYTSSLVVAGGLLAVVLTVQLFQIRRQHAAPLEEQKSREAV